VAIIAAILWAFVVVKKAVSKNQLLTNIDVPQYLPIAPKGPAMGGGGGGGSHDILQAPKGRLPKFEEQPIVPPMVIKNDHPKLVADPSIMMPKDIQLPNNNLPNLGDPRTSVVGPASNGSGSGAGMGTGSGGGIGSGKGNGYGPGEGGGYGGGLYHVGGGVSAPQLVFAPDPEFSDEARRAKYQGVCVVSLIVDAQGNPQRVQVVRHLGMGLDEKAVEAVKQYRFKPATLQGKPVPVEVNIEVNFRIY
jgi:periplasmic protein TonB